MFIAKDIAGATSLQAWEFIIPNDESDKARHDHVLVMEMPGIDESIKSDISKNVELPAINKFSVSAGKDDLLIMADQVSDLLIYKFCGIYRYLLSSEEGSECVLFDDYQFLNVGFVTATTDEESRPPQKNNELILDSSDRVTRLNTGEVISTCDGSSDL